MPIGWLLFAGCTPNADPTAPGGDPGATDPSSPPSSSQTTTPPDTTDTPPAGTTVVGAYPDPPGLGTGPAVFVSTDGDDGDDGLTVEHAVRTLERAFDVAAPGSVISVLGGTYGGLVVQDGMFGTADQWVTVRPYDDQPVTIGSSGVGPTVYFYADSCDADNDLVNGDCTAAYVRLEGLELHGSPNGGSDGNVVKIDTPKVQIVGNRIVGSVADLIKNVRTGDDTVIVGNELWQDRSLVVPGDNAQGIDITGADRLLIAGNWLHDLPDIGAYAKGNARDVVFEQNRLDDIGTGGDGNGLMCGQSTDAELLLDGDYESYGCIVRNNVISRVTGACVAIGSSQGARVYGNTCDDTATELHSPLYLTNESEIGTRNTDVEIRGNIVSQPRGVEMFGHSSRAVDDWSTVWIADNLYDADGEPQFELADDSSLDLAAFSAGLVAEGAPPDTSRLGDPAFVGPNDHHLASGSPAVDAIDCLLAVDADGHPRPAGAACDIGAYEQ